MLMMLVLVFSIGSINGFPIVHADDDDDDEKYYEHHDDEKYYKRKWKEKEHRDDEKYYKKEKWKEEEDHDDDDDYGEDGGDRKTSHWYLWDRELSTYKGSLPFIEPKTITLKKRQSKEPLSIYIVPSQGELFIPGKEVSTFLGAKTNFYKTSRILEVKQGETELISRAGSNVIYENRTKTPMPAKATYIHGDVYLPISVLANGLGYSVEWNEKEQVMNLQKMIQ
ncbi:copper amine oxidase N-terminal domain-containing protein [Oikeobacillus pervagus]|nr:copper amine oxidase N-terminal domain-containing protein [Oikeobacillus pervagus]